MDCSTGSPISCSGSSNGPSPEDDLLASWAAAGRPWNGIGRFSRGWRQATSPQAASAVGEKFNRHAPVSEKRGCGILRSVAMRILVLGGDGMLGHQLLRQLGTRHEVHATLRRDPKAYDASGLFDAKRTYFGVDGSSPERLPEIMATCRPGAVINAIGVVKQRAEAHDAIQSLEITARLPRRRATL